jgi:prepilin-type processing-associated H-X9-DG protein
MQPKQLKDNWLPVSYLYNTDYHNTSISDWTSPSQILNLDRNGEVYPYMGLKPWLNVFDMASARHNNAANALFTDFHVENLILPEITEELIRKPK